MGIQWNLRNTAPYPSGQLATLTKRAMTGKYKPHGNVREASCLIVPSFGYRRENGKITPGLCNMALARIAIDTFPDIPKFVSHEVDDALKELGHEGAYRFGEPGRYYETRAVAADTIRFILGLGLLDDGNVAVLAHQNHMPRADATIQGVLPEDKNTIAPAGLSIQWDPLSEQRRARNAANWALYEPFAIGRAATLGWLDMSQAA